MDRELARRILSWTGNPPIEIVLWDGQRVRTAGRSPLARLRLADRRTLWAIAAQGEQALGDAYCDGRVSVDGDLTAAMTATFQGWPRAPLGVLPRLLARLARRVRPTSRGDARLNVHHHYDLGNDFYALWLDEGMSYTCAYYPSPAASLEDAQRAKLDHVARKLCLRPGERVVEAGGGWGALALHLAERYGVSIRSYNVSSEQVELARWRVRRAGLERRIEIVEDDYRSIDGTYDAFVSVGMLEHVGLAQYRELGKVIDRSLKRDGRGLIHSIGRAHPYDMDPWIERRIFPGAYIPSLGQMLDVLEPTDLAVCDVENLRLHYAKTLEAWLERFEKRLPEIEARFGAEFARTWRLYLIGSIASFRSGWCQLYQMLFARPACMALPWTRAHLYRDAPASLAAEA